MGRDLRVGVISPYRCRLFDNSRPEQSSNFSDVVALSATAPELATRIFATDEDVKECQLVIFLLFHRKLYVEEDAVENLLTGGQARRGTIGTVNYLRCRRGRDDSGHGENLRLVFTSTGRAVEEDPRFSVRRVNLTTIEVTAPEGLRELEAGEIIECVASSGAKRPVNIIVEDICGPGRQPCQDGTCLPTPQFCDERVDCGDGSDEFRKHCSSK
ncbi:hypothetical protein SprV_0301177500 [Sparganum proliferum]